ncbi:MAG TPA: hypothetical protein ENI92_07440, partial [Bacteroidetes bacterium]|nr:hypothetical protein [Bacteroidota bacterium]
MMTALRKNMKTVLWILVFAFIATIIFSWGMGGFSGPIEPGIVGKVDKVKITQEQYETALQNRIALERQNSDEPISDAKMRQIRNEVWNGLVNQVLLDKWRRKIGIVVTDDEVAFTVQNFPPPSVTKNPNFLDSTGAFDMNLYRQIIADPQNVNFVIALENNVRESLFQQKMVQRISSAGHVSEPEARDEFFRSNSTAVASYVLVAARNMEVDSSAVSEEELRRLYDERREEFRLPEERTVEYVLFPDEPSREDSLDALRLAEELMERIKGGEDFEELAKEYSDDNSAAKGGDLGWFGRGRMVPPFEEAAFGAAKGALVGPVLSRFGYHIIRVDDRRGKGEAEEVKARHILIKIKRSPETLDEMRTRAEGFRDEADENGFENAARVYNVVRDTLKNVRHGAFIPRFGRNQAASDFLFKRPKGSVSPIYS